MREDFAVPMLYPPHPLHKIAPHMLGEYEETGLWTAQRKFNGTHVLVHVSAARKVSILTRHGAAPKMFTLTGEHKEQILSLDFEEGKEYWLDGELLDHKTRSSKYKGKIVFFDVLHAGEYLIRKMDQKGRLGLLANICSNPSSPEPFAGIALSVTDHIWMAENWEKDFFSRFKDFIHMDEIEGLVLRKSSSFIDNFGQKEYGVSWILRCRKPHGGGNYNF